MPLVRLELLDHREVQVQQVCQVLKVQLVAQVSKVQPVLQDQLELQEVKDPPVLPACLAVREHQEIPDQLVAQAFLDR